MPTPAQIKVFIDTFLKLNRFEMDHRAREGWGCFTDDDNLPIPEVSVVLAWLNEVKDEMPHRPEKGECDENCRS
jgi:hypothetical protein